MFKNYISGYIRLIIWPCFVTVYKFGHHIISTSIVPRLSPSPTCNEDFKGDLLLLFPAGDQHRLSHFPQKEVLDAGSQLPAPSRYDVVDSGGRVGGTLLGWHSSNMHMVELYGTLVWGR